MNYLIGKEEKTMYICSMKQRIYRIRNKRLVQGDPNLLDTNEILVKEDEMGVRLLSREGSEVKDIAYNPADKPVVPEDPYENVLWARASYKNGQRENAYGYTPYLYLNYSKKYKYVFCINCPRLSEGFYPGNTTDVDIYLVKGKDFLKQKTYKVEFGKVYICDNELNLSEAPAVVYRVRNCNGELLNVGAHKFISKHLVYAPPKIEADESFEMLLSGVTGDGYPIRKEFELSKVEGSSRKTYYYIFKRNRISTEYSDGELVGRMTIFANL